GDAHNSATRNASDGLARILNGAIRIDRDVVEQGLLTSGRSIVHDRAGVLCQGGRISHFGSLRNSEQYPRCSSGGRGTTEHPPYFNGIWFGERPYSRSQSSYPQKKSHN